MDSDGFVTIEEAAAYLDVPTDILEAFIKENNKAVASTLVLGMPLYSLADFERIQEANPSFEKRKAVSVQATVPCSISKVISDGRKFVFSRRRLLGGLAAATATGAAGAFFGEVAFNEYKASTDRQNNANDANDLFTSIFGPINGEWAYDPGKLYNDDSGYHYHRDHDAALDGILGRRRPMIECERLITTGVPQNGRLINRPPKKHYAIIGGPVSTPTVRHIWQYKSGRHGGQSLKRVSEPLLDLPYSFLIDDEDPRMNGMQRFSWTWADGGGVANSINRPLLDRRHHNKMWIPEGSPNHHNMIDGKPVSLPNTNYLIITHLPNFLHKSYEENNGRYPQKWGSLVSVQATHGIGTRAAGLLLSDNGKNALDGVKRAISTAIPDGYAFQSVFCVSKPDTIGGIDGFTKIEHEETAVIKVPIENYARIRHIISKTEGYSAPL